MRARTLSTSYLIRRCCAFDALTAHIQKPSAGAATTYATDPDSIGFQTLHLWDSNGTVGGGRFVVNGMPQTGGHVIDVSPSDFASTVFKVGTLGGTDQLWARFLQVNGELSSWTVLSDVRSSRRRKR